MCQPLSVPPFQTPTALWTRCLSLGSRRRFTVNWSRTMTREIHTMIFCHELERLRFQPLSIMWISCCTLNRCRPCGLISAAWSSASRTLHQMLARLLLLGWRTVSRRQGARLDKHASPIVLLVKAVSWRNRFTASIRSHPLTYPLKLQSPNRKNSSLNSLKSLRLPVQSIGQIVNL